MYKKRRSACLQLFLTAVSVSVLAFAAPANADDKRKSHNYSHGSPRHWAAPFEFALIGDTRYNQEGEAQFGPMRDEINGDRRLSWVLHAGDILGGTPCTDELHYERLDDFQSFRRPVIYTPGDNEWADCHYSFLGSFNPLERLARLRQIFFANPGSSLGGYPMFLQTQANQPSFQDYVENVRWVRHGVVFVTVHMIGSGNGLDPWNRDFGAGGYDPGDTIDTPRADRLAEVEARVAAGVSWLNESFELAEKIDAAGVFILSHANPGFVTRFETAPSEGHLPWVDAIRRNAVNFQRPVVLAHGDTHTARIDKPLTAATVPADPAPPAVAQVENFTRVETFGFPDTHWIRVKVDPRSEDVFSFELEVVDANRREFAPIP
jgi:hypothetical protein